MTATPNADRIARGDLYLPSVGLTVEAGFIWWWVRCPTDFAAAECAGLKHGVLSINGRQFQAWISDRDDDGRRHTVIDLEKLGTLAGRVLARCRVVVGPDGAATCDCEDGRNDLRCRHSVCCRAAIQEWAGRGAA